MKFPHCNYLWRQERDGVPSPVHGAIYLLIYNKPSLDSQSSKRLQLLTYRHPHRTPFPSPSQNPHGHKTNTSNTVSHGAAQNDQRIYKLLWQTACPPPAEPGARGNRKSYTRYQIIYVHLIRSPNLVTHGIGTVSFWYAGISLWQAGRVSVQ